MSKKHPKRDPDWKPLPDDLERSPGIGTSKGAYARTGEDPDEIEGQSTFEGDVDSDTTVTGGADLRRKGRHNK